jgi:hypothetical protein
MNRRPPGALDRLCNRRRHCLYDFDQTQRKSWPRLNFYGQRREANCRFFGLLIITEVIADTRRSSKSRLTPADLGASRLREPDCDCEVLLAISDHLSLSAVAAELLKYQNCAIRTKFLRLEHRLLCSCYKFKVLREL